MTHHRHHLHHQSQMRDEPTMKLRTGVRRLAQFAAGLMGVAALTVVAPVPGHAAVPAPDGLTSFTAAASCWEIKQNVPASASGVYWLVTPKLVAPEEFYCDMTTDGGGWVLVGRGRENWITQYEGKGTGAQLRSAVTGRRRSRPGNWARSPSTGC